ncbi:kinesin-like protein [Pseudoscourfieldia marina]
MEQHGLGGGGLNLNLRGQTNNGGGGQAFVGDSEMDVPVRDDNMNMNAAAAAALESDGQAAAAAVVYCAQEHVKSMTVKQMRALLETWRVDLAAHGVKANTRKAVWVELVVAEAQKRKDDTHALAQEEEEIEDDDDDDQQLHQPDNLADAQDDDDFVVDEAQKEDVHMHDQEEDDEEDDEEDEDAYSFPPGETEPRFSDEMRPRNLENLFAAEASALRKRKRTTLQQATVNDENSNADPSSARMQVVLRVRPPRTANNTVAPADSTCTSTLQPANAPAVRRRADAKDAVPAAGPARPCIAIESADTVRLQAPAGSEAHKRGGGGVPQMLRFGRVLGPAATQTQAYAAAAAGMVDDALLRGGTGGVVLTYGITASGKTFTLEGTRNCPGIVPQTIDRIYRHLYGADAAGRAGETERIAPRVSSFEIYGERVFDLIGPERQDARGSACVSATETDEGAARHAVSHAASAAPLPIREVAGGSVVVCGLVERPCASAAEAMALYRRCRAKRRAARTALNRSSSRSHAVFTVTLPPAAPGAAPARLTFVDLAGSERAGRTGHGGAALKESIAINASLMALGRCLEATRHNQMIAAQAAKGGAGAAPAKPPVPVPFRDSAITHLLRDPLKGIGRLVLVVGISPDACDFDETLHTLRYASAAARTRQDTTARMGAFAVPAVEKPPPKAKPPGPATQLKAAQAAAAASTSEVHQLRAEVDRLRSQLAEATRLAAEREAALKAEVRAAMASSVAMEGLRGAWEDEGDDDANDDFDDDKENDGASTGGGRRKSRRQTTVQAPRGPVAVQAPSTLERVHPALRRAAEAAELKRREKEAEVVGARVLRARNRA